MRYFNKILAKLGFDRRPVVGLDLGTTAVKILALEPSAEPGGLRLAAYAIEPLQPGVMVAGMVMQQDLLVQTIRDALRKINIPVTNICVGLPSEQVITRIMQCAAGLSDQEIGLEIALAADHYIPLPLSEVQLDYKIIAKNARDQDLVDVLVVVTKTSNLNNLAAIMHAADLELTIVEPEVYALARVASLAMNKEEVDKTITLIDFGSAAINVIFMRNGQILYDRKHAVPKANGIEQQGTCQTLNKILDVVCADNNLPALELVLFGGGAAEGLDLSALQSKFGMQVRKVDPWQKIQLAAEIAPEIFAADQSRLLQCCGLALRNLNHA